MKIFYCCFFSLIFLCIDNCFSQEEIHPVSHLNKLPPQGVLLDKGWKFQRGDNPDYAKPEYDDSKWQPIDPALDVHDLPQIKQDIVWFRLHLFVDSALLKEQLVLVIQQSGASEIYLNGSPIYSFGVFDTHPEKVKAYNPLGESFGFPVKNQGQQILAIRYVLQPGVRYNTIFAKQNFALWISVNTIEMANRNYQQYLYVRGLGYFLTGIFLMLTVLHLSFFLFYPSQKANLYFSLFALFSTLGWLVWDIVSGVHWVEYKFYSSNVAFDLMSIGRLLMVAALYYLLEQKKGIWYYTLMILCVLCIIAFALPGYWGWEIGNPLSFNLINLEIMRISFIAIKKKKRGAWIIAGGSVCCLVCTVAFFVAGLPGQADVFTFIVFILMFLSIPVSASAYLGLDFAFTNRLLQQKLFEVEQLSQTTIAQEKEKQQILATQNETLERQVTERTAELKRSFEDLKATQQQLIQSEKMASLGELTAGIAHEIQNPLNFVNNFSEVNGELIDELQSERSKMRSERDDALEDEIINDIKQNLEKINHHGKRADAIVKGMLQHSKTSTGVKEPTNINKLADEYLRLAYHGMRAKDKSFEVKIKTDFDESIGKINVVSQDMGRVLLNLFNNAFYAVNEKKKISGENYNPTVSIATKPVLSPALGGVGAIEIRVSDNGNGIPQNIVDKIFQPFFTTKPTGQGTGLGLSLAYDIIKAHGGEIKVNTKVDEGNPDKFGKAEGSEFIIQLPV